MLKKYVILILVFIVILAVIGSTFFSRGGEKSKLIGQKTESSDLTTPAGVARAYFTLWREKNYEGMYSLFSDGFKKIEPTAGTLEAFADYAESQGIDNVEIMSIKENVIDDSTASVDYEVAFYVDGRAIPYKGTYTLKYRNNDKTPGWKMIHPYGENVDTS